MYYQTRIYSAEFRKSIFAVNLSVNNTGIFYETNLFFHRLSFMNLLLDGYQASDHQKGILNFWKTNYISKSLARLFFKL